MNDRAEYYDMHEPTIITDDVCMLRDTDTYSMYCIIRDGILHDTLLRNGKTTTVKLNDGDIVIIIAKRGGFDVEVIRSQY